MFNWKLEPNQIPFDPYQSDAAIECIQKTAWRLVRAAEDRLGAGRGSEKRDYCVEKLIEIFQLQDRRQYLEDFVRAAYINFKIESSVLERRI